ncbi:hypothetical protein GN244_ATG18260 [Phytophthora infestans]|uniref:Uncharacterized protein n=1 Tax=Phytophthora infestans TaxID=4787 RepID=A0A833SLN8_PHYIN|nr:hypothetical protein GN244_ATG18260 [Phytophthora infestans]
MTGVSPAIRLCAEAACGGMLPVPSARLSGSIWALDSFKWIRWDRDFCPDIGEKRARSGRVERRDDVLMEGGRVVLALRRGIRIVGFSEEEVVGGEELVVVPMQNALWRGTM